MGKKKTTPASVQKAIRPGKVAQTKKNKELRRARHAKLHPNDAQVKNGKFTERKAPMNKGNFPTAKTKYFNEDTGQPVVAPRFSALPKAEK